MTKKLSDEEIKSASWAGEDCENVKKLYKKIEKLLKEDSKTIKTYEDQSIQNAKQVIKPILKLKIKVDKTKYSFRRILKVVLGIKANRAYEFIAFNKTQDRFPNANISFSGLVVLGQALGSNNAKRKDAALKILEKASTNKAKEKNPRSVYSVKKELQKKSKPDNDTVDYFFKQLNSFKARALKTKSSYESNKETFGKTKQNKNEIKKQITAIKKELEELEELLG